MLKSVNNISTKQIILVGDFNLYFDSSIESLSWNPILKKNLFPKWLTLKITLKFTIFGGLEIPKTKDLLFGKIVVLALFNVYWPFFVSNVLQESIYKEDVLASFCSDPSPILFALDMLKEDQRGKGLWKFNGSLLWNKKICSLHEKLYTNL